MKGRAGDGFVMLRAISRLSQCDRKGSPKGAIPAHIRMMRSIVVGERKVCCVLLSLAGGR